MDGVEYVMETPIKAGFALIRAHKADSLGNLVYRLSQRNWNPLMAMAAEVTIVEVGPRRNNSGAWTRSWSSLQAYSWTGSSR